MELKDQSTTKSGYSVVLLSGPRIQSGRARILVVVVRKFKKFNFNSILNVRIFSWSRQGSVRELPR